MEATLAQDKPDEFRRMLGPFGIGHVEISDGVLSMSLETLRLGLQGDTLRLSYLEG